ncbi:MAG: glucosyl-3-phosphoglycerate synthase [Candidatus Berkelbacteria bacterium]
MQSKKYDILIGIPSYNNAKTIGFVVDQIAQGLGKYFPDLNCAIANSDGGSIDDTVKNFNAVETPANVDKISIEHVVISGKGDAIREILKQIVAEQAGAGMIIDADIRSVTPEWAKYLLDPVVHEEYHYISPNYLRDKYDGTITRNLVYPMTNSLFGGDIHQPIGGDFAFSLRYAETILAKDVWETNVAKYGIDIFLTTTAICEGFKIGQANLGAKIHDPKDPRGLGPMLSQVASVVFELVGQYQDVWKKGKRIHPVPIVNMPITLDVPPIKINTNNLIHEFRRGIKRYRKVYLDLLLKEDFEELYRIANQKPATFAFPIKFWVKMVFDFAVKYNQSPISKDELMSVFTVLYYGRVAGYSLEVKDMTSAQAEEHTQKIAAEFRVQLPYMLKRWLRIKESNLDWFKRNTFHYSTFSHIAKLVKLKEQKKLTIAVALPTKNEAETIGYIVEMIKENFITKNKLIDEFIVIDSGSTDGTIDIVEKLGVPIYQTKDVPISTDRSAGGWGKGDNLWKSLFIVKSDIICWVDTDIRNFDPRFIYGLLGPLLTNDEIGFVKGFYRRPLQLGDSLNSSGGGRVTELTVRPLLNTFYPELSKLIQPLSGEYAGRREVLESIPFCINYALETCMMIDIYTKYGLDIIAQSDLKIRVHRNQSLASLSKLSFGIMQAVFNRLHIHGKVRLLDEPVSEDDIYTFKSIKILESQLPAINEVAEYREKFADRKPRWPIDKAKLHE